MLRGGAMADFIETYARTCRKYGASLVTATQSLNDYYKSAGSIAALENSDWFVILQQKPETIADFKKHDRFEMDDIPTRCCARSSATASNIRIMIKGPRRWRSAAWSSIPIRHAVLLEPATFAAIEALIAEGSAWTRRSSGSHFRQSRKWAAIARRDRGIAAE
jgi:conjugal transfer ATP-binding protein TraC